MSEDELLDAVTARDLAEVFVWVGSCFVTAGGCGGQSERALVAEDLKFAQTRTVDLQKNVEALHDEVRVTVTRHFDFVPVQVAIVREAAVTAAIADRCLFAPRPPPFTAGV